MKNDPLVSAVRKARSDHKKTIGGRFDLLIAEERRWARRLTIARNKHDQAVIEVFKYAAKMAGRIGTESAETLEQAHERSKG